MCTGQADYRTSTEFQNLVKSLIAFDWKSYGVYSANYLQPTFNNFPTAFI